jgi:hypothetical protein
MRIPIGAAVRSKATGRLGRTFRQRGGKMHGSLWVQWDGIRDRQIISAHYVTLVADKYATAKAWEAAKEAPAAPANDGL